MAELVTEYVGKMPQRVHSMLIAYESSHREQLIRIVHQLKGSGGGYGFPQLTVVAGRLEQRLLGVTDREITTVDNEFRALIELCGRMAA
ncbi:MAG: Hpt domain-containing protein [Phycisphaerales bacterium]|nr:Hpt domain-containing protein [Phycisphaerales bacterium]